MSATNFLFLKTSFTGPKLKAAQLDVANFVGSVKIENGVDKIKENADLMFIQNILYFVTDNRAFTALGVSKPSFDQDRIDRISKAGTIDFYKELAAVFPAVAIATQTKIKGSFVNLKPLIMQRYGNAIDDINRKYPLIASEQTIYCQSSALLEQFPYLSTYAERGPKFGFPGKLKKYLYDNQDNWANKFTMENYMVNYGALETLMNFIDPTMNMANELRGYYVGMGLKKALVNMNQVMTTYSQNILRDTLKVLDRSKDSVIIAFLSDLKKCVPALSSKIDVASNSLGLMKTILFPAKKTTDTAQVRINKLLPTLNIKKANLTLAKNRINALYRICEGSLLIATGISDVTLSDWTTIPSFLSSVAKFAVETISSFTKGDTFLVNKVLGKLAAGVGYFVPKTMDKMKIGFQKLFSSSVANFMTSYACVMLLFSSIDYVKSAVENRSEGNTGAYAIDMLCTTIAYGGGSAALICAGLGLWPLAGVILAITTLGLVIASISKIIFFDNSQEQACNNYISYLLESKGSLIDLSAP